MWNVDLHFHKYHRALTYKLRQNALEFVDMIGWSGDRQEGTFKMWSENAVWQLLFVLLKLPEFFSNGKNSITRVSNSICIWCMQGKASSFTDCFKWLSRGLYPFSDEDLFMYSSHE